MKLAVSNIAWEQAELADHLALLRELGCDGVELAPSCLWPEPAAASAEERAEVSALIRRAGLEVTGLHSLLYTRPDLQLFKDRVGLQASVAYLRQLVELCAELGGKVLVFGSPRNRLRHGRDVEECLAWAAEAFGEIAAHAHSYGVTMCIEPLAPSESDFIQSSEEGMALVRRVGHANFGLHLDAKAMIGSKEDVDDVCQRYGRSVKHLHVGDPGLAPPGSTGVDHAPIGRALRRGGYDGYVSIEMRRGFGPSRQVITTSVAYVRACYLNG